MVEQKNKVKKEQVRKDMVFKINCGLQNKLWITSSIPVTAEKYIGVVFILSFKFFNTV